VPSTPSRGCPSTTSRAAADAFFERIRAETEASPDDWRSWFRLALAYDAAGDRTRARAAARHALALHG
jgi:Flp pilus assembly protein TadD